jgi:hypothetical protein
MFPRHTLRYVREIIGDKIREEHTVSVIGEVHWGGSVAKCCVVDD